MQLVLPTASGPRQLALNKLPLKKQPVAWSVLKSPGHFEIVILTAGFVMNPAARSKSNPPEAEEDMPSVPKRIATYCLSSDTLVRIFFDIPLEPRKELLHKSGFQERQSAVESPTKQLNDPVVNLVQPVIGSRPSQEVGEGGTTVLTVSSSVEDAPKTLSTDPFAHWSFSS
jgi:hypothetical protein